MSNNRAWKSLLAVATLTLATPLLAAAPQTLEAQVAALQAEVGLLRDKASIEKLTQAYGYYLDKQLWQEIVPLFSATGSVEIAQRGVYRNRKGIETFFLKVMGHDSQGLQPGHLFNHLVLQGIVDVDPDGKHARGRWRALQWVSTYGKSMIFAEGPYENTYVKEDGVWRFQSMHYYDSYHVTEANGFTKGTMPPSGQSKAYPPDSPPSVTYDNYPGVFIPPYHYPNPGNGRPWTQSDSDKHSATGEHGPGHAVD